MRRPRLRQSKPDPSVPPEIVKEEEHLRLAILAALPDLRLPGLRALVRAVRYAEEGAEVVVVRRADLRDANHRRMLLTIYAESTDSRTSPPRAGRGGPR